MAPDEVQELLAAMPAFEENQYYYAKNQQILVFKVMLADIPDSMLFLFFAHVGTEDISRIGSIVESSQLALKWYLRGHKEFARRQIGIRKPERQSKIHFSQKYERATLFACLFFSR